MDERASGYSRQTKDTASAPAFIAGAGGRLEAGGQGVRELRIPEGKGYRVYYAWDGAAVVVLLCGGDKASQQHDIEQVNIYWRACHG